MIILQRKLLPQIEIDEVKKSPTIFGKAKNLASKLPSASEIKDSTTNFAKRTVSATKERVKARSLVASEVAAGGAVATATSAALGGVVATGAVGAAALTAAPVVAGFAAACVVGGVIKAATDDAKEEDDNNN